MIEINYLLVLALGIFSMVLGALWYGPLFGKVWCRLNNIDPNNKDEIKRMQKGMGLVYVIQFVLTTFMVFVVYVYTKPAADVMSGVQGSLWLFAGIVVPVLASALMWTSEPKRHQLKRFFIQAGYLLVLFTVIGVSVQWWG